MSDSSRSFPCGPLVVIGDALLYALPGAAGLLALLLAPAVDRWVGRFDA